MFGEIHMMDNINTIFQYGLFHKQYLYVVFSF